jgi:hypothetical protein
MKFDFSAQEANLILASLGKMPFEVVFNLIEKIQQQAKEQENVK